MGAPGSPGVGRGAEDRGEGGGGQSLFLPTPSFIASAEEE